MPGATLPLRVMFPSDRRLVEHALAAPEPLSRLLTVVSFKTQCARWMCHDVGATTWGGTLALQRVLR